MFGIPKKNYTRKFIIIALVCKINAFESYFLQRESTFHRFPISIPPHISVTILGRVGWKVFFLYKYGKWNSVCLVLTWQTQITLCNLPETNIIQTNKSERVRAKKAKEYKNEGIKCQIMCGQCQAAEFNRNLNVRSLNFGF